MKILKRTLPAALAGLLILNSAVPAVATESAGMTPSEKEEVIYITLEADGTLKNSYVVNSFSAGSITDYGNYASVKMLNTSDPIEPEWGYHHLFYLCAESLLPRGTNGCRNTVEYFPALRFGWGGVLRR